MIILTTPNIKKFNPIRQSSVVIWAQQNYCLAEVDDGFLLSESEMESKQLDFWWELTAGYFDVEMFEHKSIDETLIHEIAYTYDISKEKNIAMAIYEVSRHFGEPPFELWEKYKNND